MSAGKTIFRGILLLALAFFSFLMIRLTLPYAAMRGDIEFLHLKHVAYTSRHWRFAFYTHVFTSCLVLIAGFTQFNPWLLARYPRVHRWMGWSYLVIVTMISGPAAFVMALYANGGLPAKTSFTLLSLLWMGSTALAGYYAYRKKFMVHGEYMFRSYALTLSAITLRAYTFLLDLSRWPITPRDIYITTAWLSWVPNLLIAGLLIRRGWVKKIYRTSAAPAPSL